ncbi:deoxyribodipyrimidine photo-lyase [Vreelandella populi]|uniref:Deoxyribodipyrimidine photo-lyase n=1 Tax=Vreelandella populi TaxID=2498858 RepID=A0A3S0X032_9GAMM|nr:deoxyribodipyrimidine photo-lyase [Halomonas populi]RUR41350.1 deoxyribodipyrimidine photo-lyase [Halomonas populi]RUR44245.1 deoxyribodipyrimidine photo-lyase [Halomonas populi]
MDVQLVWLRSDLRIHDNSALAAAAAKGPVVAVFLRSIAQWQSHGHGANKIVFWARGVAAVKGALNGLNIPLLHRDIESYAEAPKALLEIAREHSIKRLHFNYQYPLNEQRRDRAVLDAFKNEGIPAHGYHDAVAFAPGTLLTGKGGYYGVFTPFSKAWHKQISAEQLTLRDTPEPQKRLSIKSDKLPDLPKLDDQPVSNNEWPAGEDTAGDHLARFLRFRGRHYRQQRDFPNVRGTSELSPYLALGMISHRQCLQAVMSENGGHLADGDAGLTTWVNELIWREFYQHVAVGFSEVCRYQPFQEHTKHLAWRDDAEGFRAWCEGRTGYPLVDAAMRQMVATGWMHNRLRMVTAMFLSKHLLIDWRRGEAFFMRHLVDGEFCANNGGWQWAASTGTDSAPYFRIFNPTTQSKRFDPDGEFIAKWLPALSELPAKARHAPPRDMLTQLDYPEPVVDHKAARQRALDAFKTLTR